MDTNRGSRKAALLVILVFVLGIALGGAGTYVVTDRVQAARLQSPHPGGLMSAMIKDMNLTAEQQTQIEAILSDTRAEYATIRKQADPQYEQARQSGRQRIRQVLTPEQGPKFEDMLRKLDEERRQRQAQGR